MGYFLQGYEVGCRSMKEEMTAQEVKDAVQEIVKNGTYGDCVEWYNGFYKAGLDSTLSSLQHIFEKAKEAGEKNGNSE